MKIVYLSHEISLESNHDVTIISHESYRQAGLRNTVEEIRKIQPDLILEREFNDGKSYFDELYRELPDFKTAFWAIDSHLSFDRHVRYMRNFDYGFCAISGHRDGFAEKTKKPFFWLPLYLPGTTIGQEILKEKTASIRFIGNFEKSFFVRRRQYIEHIRALWGKKFQALTDYKNMPRLINEAIVHFNCSLNQDMNFRVFETLGYGAFLITDSVPDLYKIKNLKNHIDIYDTKSQAQDMIADKIEFYRKNPKFAFDDLKKNQYFVLKNHTLLNRFDEIIQMIVTGKQFEY